MVEHPGDYPWSSFRHNGMGLDIGLISEHEVYKQLGSTPSARLIAYRNLFAQEFSPGFLDEIRLHTNKEWVIGYEIFIKQIEEALGRKINQKQWGGNRRSGNSRGFLKLSSLD